ncbi:Endoglucanase precursor [compost metagenome]
MKPFADVPSDAWYAADVAAAQAVGIALGSDGNFRPNDSISRAEVVSLITRAYENKHGAITMPLATPSFRDGKSIPSWANEAVIKASSLQLVNGYTDSTFRPGNPATRAEAVKLIVGLCLQM